MSITEFARVATSTTAGDVPKPVSSKRPQLRAPSDLVIGVCLVHLLRHDGARQNLINYLIENPNDFGHFIDLLVPCGGEYLNDISVLARATQGYDHLSEIIRQAYERHIANIYFDTVEKRWETQRTGRVAKVADDSGWKLFLRKCAKRPELAFVIDVARDMISPLGDHPFVPPPAPTESIVAAPSAPVPVGMR